ncbi:MAG: hypothetical protein MR966_11420 [Lachnospiraceae bacterium]|nr:hypothetical protein [Lachnospiraceae bacterium]
MSNRMEKVYKVMRTSGAWNIVIGIVLIAVSVTAGVISIVNGAALLKNKSDITF